MHADWLSAVWGQGCAGRRKQRGRGGALRRQQSHRPAWSRAFAGELAREAALETQKDTEASGREL